MQDIVLSILIPLYNTEKYIDACLRSVVRQMVPGVELIIIDDGSTDNSLKLAEKYSAENVRIISRDNRGQLKTRSELSRMANGRYVMFIDSDDLIADDAVQIIMSAVDENKYDMILFDYCAFDSSASSKKEIKLFGNSYSGNAEPLQPTEVYRKILVGEYINNVWCKLYRKTIIDGFVFENLDDIRNGEDIIQSVVAISKACSFGYIGRDLYYYRNNPNSVSKKIYKADIIGAVRIFSILKKYAISWDLYQQEGKTIRVNSYDQMCFRLLPVAADSDYDDINKLVILLSDDQDVKELCAESSFKRNKIAHVFITLLLNKRTGLLWLFAHTVVKLMFREKIMIE